MKEHQAALKRLQDEMNAHVASQGALDTTSQEAVDAFNAKLDALNAQGDELNKVAEQSDREQNDYNAKATASNARCAGMVISIADKKAVLKERAAQGGR